MNEKPIGIFDSGVGGLTVLREIERLLPNENILYLGDTARVPYGIRSAETVIKYSVECAEFLYRRGIKVLVVACNTSSSIGLQRLREKFDIPVLGVIEPGVRAALKASKRRKIGVIGTEATIKSNSYRKAIEREDSEVEVISKACPLFVPLVEEGIFEGTLAQLVIEMYLGELKESGIDTLILGCTHYPLLKGAIKQYMKDIILVDSAEEVAKDVKQILEELSLLNRNSSVGHRSFFVTDSPERFRQIGEIFLNHEIEKIEKINLEEELR